MVSCTRDCTPTLPTRYLMTTLLKHLLKVNRKTRTVSLTTSWQRVRAPSHIKQGNRKEVARESSRKTSLSLPHCTDFIQ